MAERIIDIVHNVDDLIWGTPMLVLLAVCGIYLTVKTNFVQFKHFGLSIKYTFLGLFSGGKSEKGAMTSFEAVCTALAGTVGTGNITGVIVALGIGGAGTVFWMWISAAIGMAIKYSEILLAMRYRERNKDGERVGGPMYYMKNGLGKRWSGMAKAFAIFTVIASMGAGNMVQTACIADAVRGVCSVLQRDISADILCALAGTVCAIFVARAINGGIKVRGKIAAKLVPFMALLYIGGATAVIVKFSDRLVPVLIRIIGEAFSKDAILGGAAGSVITWGFKRGIFSNEAGLGSSPIVHAESDTKEPVEQALLGLFEVFVDTVVICTLTALAVLTSDIAIGDNAAAACVKAFGTVFGDRLALSFITVSIVLFAYSSIVGWSVYGERCINYLAGDRAIKAYRAMFVTTVFIAANMSLTFMIELADMFNGFMMLINMSAVMLLSGTVSRETESYFAPNKKKKARSDMYSYGVLSKHKKTASL